MADKKDHGSSDSTSFIFDIIHDEMKPDHLLSPESLTKKKRDNEIFFRKVSYIALLESIRIYENMMAFMQAQLEKLKLDEQRRRYEYADEIQVLPHVVREKELVWDEKNVQEFLTKEQSERLEAIEFKYNELINYLDTKIASLDETIEELEHNVENLETKAQENRFQLSESLKTYFDEQMADPDFEPKIYALPLPEKFAKERGTEEYKGEISIEKNDLKQIADELNRGLKTGEIQASSLGGSIKQMMDKLFKTKVNNKLSNVDPGKRREIAREIKTADQQTHFLNDFIKDISKRKPEIVDLLHEANRYEKKFTEAKLSFAELQAFRHELANEKNIIINQKEQGGFNTFLTTKQTAESIDNKLNEFENFVDKETARIQAIETKHEEHLNFNLSIDTDMDNLLGDLNSIINTAEDIKNENYNPVKQKEIELSLENAHIKVDVLIEKTAAMGLVKEPVKPEPAEETPEPPVTTLRR